MQLLKGFCRHWYMRHTPFHINTVWNFIIPVLTQRKASESWRREQSCPSVPQPASWQRMNSHPCLQSLEFFTISSSEQWNILCYLTSRDSGNTKSDISCGCYSLSSEFSLIKSGKLSDQSSYSLSQCKPIIQ